METRELLKLHIILWGGEVVDKELVADGVVKTILVKLRALEEVGVGFFSKDDVTVGDRLAVILGSVNARYYKKLFEVEEKEEDIKSVLKSAENVGVELTLEEIVALSKIRRLIISKIDREGLSLTLSKMLDVTEKGKSIGIKRKV